MSPVAFFASMTEHLKLDAITRTTRFALLVRESVRFWARVALRSRRLGRYRLRGSDVVVYVRHGTVDVLTLDQIVGSGHYEPPQQVTRLLDEAGPLQVVDLGANIGVFGAFILRRYGGSTITAIEPHPANVAVLLRVVEANACRADWRVIEACAGTEDGTASLAIDGEFTTARIDSAARKSVTVSTLDVFPLLEKVDLLKIDIEGSEWGLLDDPRFASVPARAVALEYHPYQCPSEDARALARQRLEEAGYETADADFDAPLGAGMLWAWRSESAGPRS
jgi:FkbM family methyltransferase